jgi:AcrR family transcriptional regulator
MTTARAASGDAAVPDNGQRAKRAKRAYTKRARAEKEAGTHARILSATLELWAEHGPADTTITAVAKRARVQRLTVYRHFPDEEALAHGARARFEEAFPVPDPAAWASLGHPAKRLRRALRALYTYYRDAEPVLARLHRAERRTPALSAWLLEAERYLDGLLATLEAGWPTGRKRAIRINAALRLAIRFETWHCLAAAGLSAEPAARLMERMVRGLARKRPR